VLIVTPDFTSSDFTTKIKTLESARATRLAPEGPGFNSILHIAHRLNQLVASPTMEGEGIVVGDSHKFHPMVWSVKVMDVVEECRTHRLIN
jgi:hypothetical protein